MGVHERVGKGVSCSQELEREITERIRLDEVMKKGGCKKLEGLHLLWAYRWGFLWTIAINPNTATSRGYIRIIYPPVLQMNKQT